MKHLYLVKHASFLTKIGFHTAGIYTEGEVALLEASGEYIYEKKKLVATCNGVEVEVRRKSRFPRTRLDKYGVGVECVE